MKKIIIVFSFLLILVSCTKESISPTQAQINASKMKAAISNGQVTSVYIAEGAYTLFSANISNNNYSISSDGFLILGANSYSLEKLIYFQYSTGALFLQY
jgi:hypothetical protein